ncbi:hypothetical protein V5799_030833 [Amblyomma americanum]|uniref:legumain n=1 Tax=Amblyomma americanum TaxID=6943 RepID=A0AAQ4ELY7_AMBAM
MDLWTLLVSFLSWASNFGPLPENFNNADDLFAASPKRWAILVAGSKTYKNYRHQADVCHAYQVLHRHGVPDRRIVVMMYDDIAKDPQNPDKRRLYNRPDGPDVYKGVPKDYTEDLVTPFNFLQILQGKKIKGGSKKVIASGPKDHIFIYFSGHGTTGLVRFPNGEALFATDFVNVLQTMHAEKRYAKMTIYVEACKSGSMFANLLPNNIDIYATTAANPFEPSYACYWDGNRAAYLGNKYSTSWMEDSDAQDLKTRSLNEQYEFVKAETTRSHVMQYGDDAMGALKVGDFQGDKIVKPFVFPFFPCGGTPDCDTNVAVLKHQIAEATDPVRRMSLQKKLNQTLEERYFVEMKIAKIAKYVAQEGGNATKALLSTRRIVTNFDCYKGAVLYFSERCSSIYKHTYALEHLHVLANACDSGYTLPVLTAAMDKACSHDDVAGTA